jgi:hypothetical protein
MFHIDHPEKPGNYAIAEELNRTCFSIGRRHGLAFDGGLQRPNFRVARDTDGAPSDTSQKASGTTTTHFPEWRFYAPDPIAAPAGQCW